MRYTLIVITFYSMHWASAQGFGEANAKWNFSYADFSSSGIVQWTTAGDTVISENICKIFSKTYEITDFPADSLITGSYPDDILYEDSGVVYWHNPELEVFDTLFWFGAVPGQSWSIAAPSIHGFDVTYVVTDTATLNINGLDRKMLSVQYSSGVADGDDILIEGIGPTVGYMTPWDQISASVDGEHEGNSFLCFYDDNIGEYKTSEEVQCDFTLADDDFWVNEQISIYPNPATQILYINYPEVLPEIFICNSMGERFKCNAREDAIFLFGFPAGYYWLGIPERKIYLPFIKMD